MTLYELLLFLHVVAVVVWVGGGVLSQVFASRALVAKDPHDLVTIVENVAWAGNRIFLPASLLTLGFGVGMVIEGPWAFRDLWIALGLAGIAATAITGSAFLGPQSKKLEAAIADKGPTDPETRAYARRILMVQRVDMVVLLLVILDMVVKPGA